MHSADSSADSAGSESQWSDAVPVAAHACRCQYNSHGCWMQSWWRPCSCSSTSATCTGNSQTRRSVIVGCHMFKRAILDAFYQPGKCNLLLDKVSVMLLYNFVYYVLSDFNIHIPVDCLLSTFYTIQKHWSVTKAWFEWKLLTSY